MDYVDRLKKLGFSHVLALDGNSCGQQERTVVLALWTYSMEPYDADEQDAWVHPYYRISHRAYQAAHCFVEACKAEGHEVALRDDIRLKPIFARLSCLTQGRNTLSYFDGWGSRFYTKTFTVDEFLPYTHVLEDEAKPLHCGSCSRCMDACPTKAITKDGFVMERCIRYWMMSGKVVPEEIRRAMGNRLIGCDECQRCCPHNPPAQGQPGERVPLAELLTEHKRWAEQLKGEIGVNLSLPNRVLSQACLIAGCSSRCDLLPALEGLQEHPSPVVREHAAWAADRLKENQLP